MAPQTRPPHPRTRPPGSAKGAGSKGGPGARKGLGGVLHPVDTDPSAYDRTDPFTALNVLRRLLSALPSRAGGCAYRLRADEHALALHLLAVVEPFVGLAPCASRRVLARLPTEVLDAIAGCVDGRRDLLALGMACRRTCAVVFPRHWEYRVIRCKASAVGVWNHLVVHRGLARNVRMLEILDERAGEGERSVPADVGVLGTDTDLESTDDELGLDEKQSRYLVAALGRMSALQSFKWSCNHSLVSFESVWPALVKLQTLREVEVNDNLIFQRAPVEEDEEGDGQKAPGRKREVVLHGLKKIGVHSAKSTFGACKTPDLSRISSMLHKCPNLESLDISYVPRRSPGFFNPAADDFLLCGRWASLRALTLTHLWCTPHGGLDAVASFLAAHTALEVLHLDVAFGTTGYEATLRSGFTFPPNCLPRLRELKASREVAGALLACPCEGTPRPLETLKGVRLSGSARDRAFLECLKAFGGMGVRRLELAGWTEMEDVRRLAECVPSLVWLDLGKRGAAGPSSKLAAAANVVPNFTEWGDILAQMPELTTLHGIRFFYEVACTDSSAPAAAHLSLSDRSRVRKNEEVASVLAWKCPKLRRLDHWDDASGRIIVLVRDAERVRYEVRRVKT